MRLMNEFEWKRWISYYFLVLAAIITYVLISNFSVVQSFFSRLFGYFAPFIAGFVIAYLLDIPCSFLEKVFIKSNYKLVSKRARGLSVLLVYSLFIALIVIMLRIIIPEFAKNTIEFISNLPVYLNNVNVFLTDFLESDAISNQIDVEGIRQTLTVPYVLDLIGVKNFNFSSMWEWLIGIIGVSSYVFNGFLALISSIYILLESKSISLFFSRLFKVFVPEKNANIIIKYIHSTNIYFKKFLYCILIDGLIVGVISVAGLSVIQTKYAFVLGVVAGITNIIPYFGAIVGTIIVFVIVIFTDGIYKALAVLIFLFILQQIDGNIIKPKLFGGSFNMSPFVVILSITIAGSYYGVVGMVIAIPVVAVLNTMLNDVMNHFIFKKARAQTAKENALLSEE